MANNLSIRFSAASSAAAITPSTPSVPSDELTAVSGLDSSVRNEESTALSASGKDSPDTNVEINAESGVPHCDSYNRPSDATKDSSPDINLSSNDPHHSHFSDNSTARDESPTNTVKKKSSASVGAKVDKFMRQLHESINTSTIAATNSGSRQEAPVMSFCKFDKNSEATLEIVNSNQVESDHLQGESVSITLTPASASKSPLTTTSASTNNRWLSEMKLYNSFRDKWRTEKGDKKSTDEAEYHHPGDVGIAHQHRKGTESSQARPDGPNSSTPLPSPSQVTVSNPCYLNNCVANNNHVHSLYDSCSSRRNHQHKLQQQQQSSLPSPHQHTPHCSCAREGAQSKCSTPQRTPTPPLLLSPSEVIFDPTLEPFLVPDNSMIFPFKSRKNSTDGKDKKEKKDKEVKESKRSKLFSSSNNSQMKESAKKSKESKDKDKEKESLNFMKIISTRSPSISSSNSFLTPSANSNSNTSLSSFFSIKTTSTKNSSPTQSRSSSTENIEKDVNNSDNSVQTQTNLNLKNIPKNSKIPSSKSMISFKKLKGENEAEAVLDDDFSSMMMHTTSAVVAPQGNPTLRRKADSFRRDSPTNDSYFLSSNEDALSISSKSSASSATNVEPEKNQATLAQTSEQPARPPLSVFSLHTQDLSNVFSWAMCFSYAYYIFALVVALVSLFISLISPLPSFMNGFFLGFMCTFLLVTVVIIYAFSNYVFVKSHTTEHRTVTPDSVSLKRMKSKKLSLNGLLNVDTGAFSGWVYEFIGQYEEREKNGFASRLVFLVLFGSKLHVLTPQQELNEKRLKLLMAENKIPSFASQRIIDFTKQNEKRITLFLTKNVRNQRKYIWSKKYPICLEFNDDRSTSGGGYLVNGREDVTEPVSALHERAKTPGESPLMIKLVIFARTCREKEEWFWAIKSSMESASKGSSSPKSSALSLADSLNSDQTETIETNFPDFTNSSQQQYLRILTRRTNYHNYMRNVLNTEGIGQNSSGMMTPLTWFNVLLNRLSFDVLNKPNWSAYIAKKLQRKLKKLRLPYFMESLTITDIDIGTTLPKFNAVPTVPVVDDAGLWIDFDVSYSGGFTMTLETKLNLMKLKNRDSDIQLSMSNLSSSESGLLSPVDSSSMSSSSSKQQKHWCGYKFRTSISTNNGSDENEEFAIDSDSDLDSIGTSSEDEEPETAPADPDDADTDEKQRKVIRFVDKIASSQYFQKATQINFLRKAIEGVSKMSIMLTVQINSLNGILAINIPESPSDRLWYGFRNEPNFQITARPKVGDHDLNLHYVTNFIEKKLRAEFFNYFVIPNMDDLFIPALNTSIEQYISVVP